jgi:hypothetical protein
VLPNSILPTSISNHVCNYFAADSRTACRCRPAPHCLKTFTPKPTKQLEQSVHQDHNGGPLLPNHLQAHQLVHQETGEDVLLRSIHHLNLQIHTISESHREVPSLSHHVLLVQDKTNTCGPTMALTVVHLHLAGLLRVNIQRQ